MPDAITSGAAFFRVIHMGGLKVRKQPSLTSETTGQIIEYGRIIACNQCVQDGSAWFVHVVDVGGWVVAQSGNLKAMERIEGPKRVQGEWFYEVVHQNGMKFAAVPDITAERHDIVHPRGTVVKGIEKVTEAASPLTVVRLENNFGWLFESTFTGEVLDRLDDDVVVVPLGSLPHSAPERQQEPSLSSSFQKQQQLQQQQQQQHKLPINDDHRDQDVDRNMSSHFFSNLGRDNNPLPPPRGESGINGGLGGLWHDPIAPPFADRSKDPPSLPAPGLFGGPSQQLSAFPSSHTVGSRLGRGGHDLLSSGVGGGAFASMAPGPTPGSIPSLSASLSSQHWTSSSSSPMLGPQGLLGVENKPSLAQKTIGPPGPIRNPNANPHAAVASLSHAPLLGGAPVDVAPIAPPILPPPVAAKNAQLFRLPPLEQRVIREFWAVITSPKPLQVLLFPDGEKVPTLGPSLQPGAVFRCSQICSVSLESPADRNGVNSDASKSSDLSHVPLENPYDLPIEGGKNADDGGVDDLTGNRNGVLSSSDVNTLTAFDDDKIPGSSSSAELVLTGPNGNGIASRTLRKTAFRLKEGGWILAESIDDGTQLARQLDEVTCDEWYRIVYKGGVTLRGKPCMADRLEVALPMGCWVRVSQRVTQWLPKQDPLETVTTFLKLEGCVGARPRVEEGWVFDQAGGHVAAQLTKEPSVLRGPDLLVIVLYPGGIKLRTTPSLEATLLGPVAKAFETQAVDGIVTSHDGLESYALLSGGSWLPCRGPQGLEVARKTTEKSQVSPGLFEVYVKINNAEPEQNANLLSRIFYRYPCLDEPPCAPPGPVHTMMSSSMMYICNYSVRYANAGVTFCRLQIPGSELHSHSQAPMYWVKDTGDGLIAIKRMGDIPPAGHI